MMSCCEKRGSVNLRKTWTQRRFSSGQTLLRNWGESNEKKRKGGGEGEKAQKNNNFSSNTFILFTARAQVLGNMIF